MDEAVEFEVGEDGEPRLDGAPGEPTQGPDPAAEAATALMPVPGWTQQEAARVVGGLVANVTLAIYAVKYQAPPAPELWPHIAGNPEQEFPLMGAGLAPVLDFIAPKGSAAAVGVSLTAGAGELIGALARRAAVLATPPPAPARPAPAAAEPQASPTPAEAGGFRYSGEQLRVLARADNPLVGHGIE